MTHHIVADIPTEKWYRLPTFVQDVLFLTERYVNGRVTLDEFNERLAALQRMEKIRRRRAA